MLAAACNTIVKCIDIFVEDVLNLCKNKVFSEQKSNPFVKKQATCHFWRKWKVCAQIHGNVSCLFVSLGGAHTDITIGDMLSLFTGAEIITTLGFGDAILTFSDINPYPTASTCALCLTLSTMYNKECARFKEKFVYALCNHGAWVWPVLENMQTYYT